MKIRLMHSAFVFAVAAVALRGSDASLEQAWRQALYAVERSDQDGFTARNLAQGLEVSFRTSETRLISNTGGAKNETMLRLVGYGYGKRLERPEPARLASMGNRVEYRRDTLTEWYVNEARGLEQGFTLSARPGGITGGPLMIALELTGALHPNLRSPREVALLDSTGNAVLRYGDLKAWDARGRTLASRLAVDGGQVRLIVEDARAVYPVTIDPTVTQILLLPSDVASSTGLGQSVAISGNTAVAGAPTDGGAIGAAYVFVVSNGTWSQQAKLTASDGVSGDQFGNSISVDGETAVVGAAASNSTRGAVYVFVRSGSSWSQQAKLVASDGASGDHFGVSVAVAGNTVVVGASGAALGQGAAYVFSAAGSTWTQQAKLTAADGASGDQFGASVSLSGTTFVAGAAGKSVSRGAAYVFISSGTTWTQQAKLTASDGVNGDQFGAAVSVSGDTFLAGATAKNCQFSCGTAQAAGLGGAYVFARSGANWSQQAELTSTDGQSAGFGGSVAINGTTAIVVQPYSNSQLFGSAFVFVHSASNWTLQATLKPSDFGVGDGLGGVAVSGNLAVFGAPGKINGQGAVYIFAQAGTNWAQQAELRGSGATSADAFGSTLAVNGDTALIASPSSKASQGAVYVFVRSDMDATWSQQAKLTLSGGASGASFGRAVSLSGDTAVITAIDAAYVFVRSGTKWTLQAKLAASDTVMSDNFGGAVAVDGDTAVVGASFQNSFRGSAYLFVRSGANWTQQAKLTASDAAINNFFGGSVSLSGDTVLTGARANSSQGAAYVFVRSGTTWTQQAKLVASDAASADNFGTSVSLSGDTAIAGAYFKAAAEGAAYVFVRSGANWAQQAKLQASDAATRDAFGISVCVDGDLALAGASLKAGSQGAAYVFVRSGSTWTQYMKLIAAGGAAGDLFGSAVSISGGTVLSGAPSHAGGEGAAYVFPLPTISSGGIVHAASFAHVVAPGSIASVFGTNYANTNGSASSTPLPETLNEVSISVNNTPAPLIFVGQFQANFQVPFEIAPGKATVVVTVNGVASPPATVSVNAVEPGIFITGSNQAVVLNHDNSLADDSHPAKVGTVVVMYVTGLGALDHPLQTGFPASANPLSNAQNVPTVTIGGANAVVSFAGMTPGFVGLGQINMQIPKLTTGSYPVVIKQGGQTSNNPVMSVTQ